MKRIIVMDGQGGGIGGAIIRRLKAHYGESVAVVALGTNAIATAQMLKAGANRGASGENAIVLTVREADVIVGPIALIMPHAMMGEFTPKMAEAVALSPARKLLLPLTQENLAVVGAPCLPLPHLIDVMIKEYIKI